MPTRKGPSPRAIALPIDHLDKLNNPQDAAALAELTRQALPAKTRRDFHRLLGFSEALSLDQEPGAAIHFYQELAAPYKKVPPLLDMHFRDLARLQLEMHAWESIRDAELQHRAEQSELEERRRLFERDRDVGATAPNVFEKGLCREADSSSKFRDQSQCLILIKDSLERRQFSEMEHVLTRLYGNNLMPDHERGQMICGCCQTLMDSHGAAPAKDAAPMDEDQFKHLLTLVGDEHRDVMKAWELELSSKTLTESAKRARLATTREDHWMNRQGDRLRQAIDRKVKFTVTLLKVLGLGQKTRPTHRKKRRKTRRVSPKIRRGRPHVT